MTSPLPPGWLDELGEFLAIPSVSADPAHAGDVTRAAEWIAGTVRRLGGEMDILEGGRLVAGEIAGQPGAPTVLVYGHYDVQPPDAVGERPVHGGRAGRVALRARCGGRQGSALDAAEGDRVARRRRPAARQLPHRL